MRMLCINLYVSKLTILSLRENIQMSTIRLFRQYIPTSFLMLGAIEALVFVGSLYIGVKTGLHVSWLELGDFLQTLAPEALFFSIVMLMSLAGVGLYQRRLKEGRAGMILRIFIGIGVGIILINQFSYTIPDLDLGHNVWLAVVGFALLGVLFARLLFFKALNAVVLQRRIIVLGAGEKAKSLVIDKGQFGQCGFKIIGFVPLEDEFARIDHDLIIAAKQDLLKLAKKYRTDEIVVAIDSKKSTFPTDSLIKCKLYGIEVVDIVSFFEREAGKITIDWVSPSWFIFADGFQRGKWRKRIKRISDIVLSLSLLVLFSPFIILTVLAVWLESKCRGPIFYRQIRVGEQAKCFQLLKFRSMQVDAEKNEGAQWAQKNDPRITKVGKFIRRTRLDELPQLLNVFRGEMSFVGPRPERPEFVSQLQRKIPFYKERHAVKPGITGWAQVCYPYGASEDDAFKKLEYDLYYVKNNSLFLDFVILLQTAEVVMWSKGAR
jgi:sugar transferase (PEP-CTERM system associated)